MTTQFWKNSMRSKWVAIGLLTMMCVACQSNPKKLTLSGERWFVSESSDHRCQQLQIGANNLGWVHNATSTNLGVVAQKCLTDASSDLALHGGATLKAQEQLGYLDDWALFPWHGGPAMPLQIPGLTAFSSPAFCGKYVAFWAFANRSDQALGMSPTLIMKISQIVNGKTKIEMASQRAMIATDDSGYLAIPKWNAACSRASFKDPKSQIETVLTIAR